MTNNTHQEVYLHRELIGFGEVTPLVKSSEEEVVGYIIPITYDGGNLYFEQSGMPFMKVTSKYGDNKVSAMVLPESPLATAINMVNSVVRDTIMVDKTFDKDVSDLTPSLSQKFKEISKIRDIVEQNKNIFLKFSEQSGIFDKDGEWISGGYDKLINSGRAYASIWIKSIFIGKSTVTMQLEVDQIIALSSKKPSTRRQLTLDLSKLSI
ncbi:hypothetical protein LPJ53_004514 [Coemansia erecta]|uniref:Uncharacterized protein n=1 Tax=Coemansia erecta TaxID=147472 RepID=A0A9W7XXL6_9FUNG|nr:hypothetical protein LPJ53_004514 [Coemansia erecta]